MPKVLDDLTMGSDGQLYTVAYATGELLRVHPRTGSACVVADGFVTPTSVHAPEAFGDFDPERHMFVTESTGRIQLVELRRLGQGACRPAQFRGDARLDRGGVTLMTSTPLSWRCTRRTPPWS